jgi:putative Mn2+ efflux pump MntP
MDYFSIIIIAIALAMDAFSVSISCGMIIDKPDLGHYFRLSFHFGLFQFLMPIAGFFAGRYLETYIKTYDHWVAFALLILIGLKMIKDSFDKKNNNKIGKDPSHGFTLLLLAVATSIDALAVGISIGVLNKPILIPSIIIGVVCSFFSIIGIALGNRVSKYITNGAGIIGGIMLILIGIKILVEHTT